MLYEGPVGWAEILEEYLPADCYTNMTRNRNTVRKMEIHSENITYLVINAKEYSSDKPTYKLRGI